MRFSERYGYKTVREVFQKEYINTKLKNSLWNAISECIFDKYSCSSLARVNLISGSNLESFLNYYFMVISKKELTKSHTQ